MESSMVMEKNETKMPYTCEHFNYHCTDPVRPSSAVCMYDGVNCGLCVKETCVVKDKGSIPVATYYGYENWK